MAERPSSHAAEKLNDFLGKSDKSGCPFLWILSFGQAKESISSPNCEIKKELLNVIGDETPDKLVKCITLKPKGDKWN